MINNGYAEHVPEVRIDDLEYLHLHHHAVSKKNGNMRIVYDCANMFNGMLLSDQCLQGPNLNNPLLNVLLRFCEFEFAFMVDVESMYFQVMVPQRDRDTDRANKWLKWIASLEELESVRIPKCINVVVVVRLRSWFVSV